MTRAPRVDHVLADHAGARVRLLGLVDDLSAERTEAPDVFQGLPGTFNVLQRWLGGFSGLKVGRTPDATNPPHKKTSQEIDSYNSAKASPATGTAWPPFAVAVKS